MLDIHYKSITNPATAKNISFCRPPHNLCPVVTRRLVLSEMQEILKSLVAAPVDGGDSGQDSGPTPYHPDPALKTHPMLPMQFHSFDRSVPLTV